MNTYDTNQLLPCPFCGAGETQIRENGRIWNGVTYTKPTSVSVLHWCERPEGQPFCTLEKIGRDRESAIAAWNRRVAPTPPAQAEPSDEEIEALALSSGINKSDEHWGSRYYTELGSSLFRFARALLSRYGQAPAASAEPAFWYVDGPDIGRLCTSYDEAASLAHEECTITKLYAAPVAAQAPAANGDALDAARYRWLKTQMRATSVDMNGKHTWTLGWPLPRALNVDAACDAGIAAIQSESGRRG